MQRSAPHPSRTAVLAAIQLPGVSDAEHESSLAELTRLVETLGLRVIGRVSQKRKAAASGSLLGPGKLKELAAFTGGSGVIRGFSGPDAADDDGLEEVEEEDSFDAPERREKATLVVVDLEISPSQLRNLEEALGVEVLDRTGVILEIFSRHARSREARLQVEIAKLAYTAPRLRASRIGGDRQGGGIGAKGAGESAHELDRRRVRDRIAELREQLASIQSEQDTRRSLRKDVPTVALVGYTNAGKSSLMRALTGSDVLVEDKLFATLDTTVRALQPPTTPRILISDTVGFINKLPHDLVASFRSTLDEALHASLLLFAADASDATFRSQLEVTRKVLAEIGADTIPSRLLLNKRDRLTPEQEAELRAEFPDALIVSTREPQDIKTIWETIVAFFEEDMSEAELQIPYTKGHLIGEVRSAARVLQESFDENGTCLRVRANAHVLERLQKLIERVDK